MSTVPKSPPSLTFVRYPVIDLGSASILFRDPSRLTGIYVLEFADGARYVGQTRNIVQRYAAHRRHHGDILYLSFAPCARERLDAAERTTVHEQERIAPLRNIALTSLPGGDGDLATMIDDKISVILPWERERRLTVDTTLDARRTRFSELARRGDYPALRRTLAHYVAETIPDPINTKRYAWTLTALPTTGRQKGVRRLFTFSCGNIETLLVLEGILDDGSQGLVACLNVAEDPERALEVAMRPLSAAGRLHISIFDTSYKAADNVVRIEADTIDALDEVLTDPVVLDAAYRLNVQMMRRGPSMFARFHNDVFAEDVLQAIYLPADRRRSPDLDKG
ncbi:MAG: GIY-YIG nuclease family protein [Cellulomonas sp.]|nr:GIY-YIG nuclease family protein [Cellulomonas sp.]